MSSPSNDPKAPDSRPGSPQTYTTFRLRDGLFGTATAMVKEVTALPPLTPIPQAPAAIRGYVNLRGHIVLVVDLNCLLRRERTALTPDSRLIVLKPELGDALGVLVERIGDIVEVSAGQIETHQAGTEAGGADLGDRPEEELICGVGKLDGELLSIVEARALVPCLERGVARRGAVADRPRLAPVKEISL
jgi:purine-binding chemotaxis protein CheW